MQSAREAALGLGREARDEAAGVLRNRGAGKVKAGRPGDRARAPACGAARKCRESGRAGGGRRPWVLKA